MTTDPPPMLSGGAPGAPGKWHARWRAIDWPLVLWLLAFKGLLFGFAFLSVRTLSDQQLDWSTMWHRWDALHYRVLAQSGYHTTGEERFSIVFFPLYPWLVRLTSVLVRDYLAAAFVVSGIASVVAGLLLEKLARLENSAATARFAVCFLFFFPTSYFLHIGYTESLFLALVLGSILAARHDHWALAGALGACASMTRMNGMLLVPVLAVEAWERFRVSRRFDRRWLWIGTISLGLGTYLALNQYVTGDPFTFSKILEEHWYKRFAPPWIGIYDAWLRVPGMNATEGFHEFFYIALGFLCTIWCWVRLRPSYAVWMTCNWLLVTSTAFVMSVPRYTLVLFPIFILFAQVAVKRPLVGMLIVAWSLMFLALFVGKFVQGTWAF